MASKNTICLWYDGTALDAARFYAKTFPDSAVGFAKKAKIKWMRGAELVIPG
jgi:2-polyprenyl-6-hydroxyphenyl methylase/3-demethylubiquinone-9 3-methyltransferase